MKRLLLWGAAAFTVGFAVSLFAIFNAASADHLEPTLPTLDAQVGWGFLGLGSTASPDGWARGLLNAYDERMTFSPYNSGPENIRVIVGKGQTIHGCANVMVRIESMYAEGRVPSYEGDVPHRATREGKAVICKGEAI